MQWKFNKNASGIMSGVVTTGNSVAQDISALNTDVGGRSHKIVTVSATLSTSVNSVTISNSAINADMVCVAWRITSGTVTSLISTPSVSTSAGQAIVSCSAFPQASVTIEICLSD